MSILTQASNRAKSSAGRSFPHPYIGVSQKVAYTGTSAQSTAFGANTTLVRLVATSNCHVLVGANPTALADGTCLYVPLNTVVFIGVLPGQKIAAIQDSAGGNLFVTEGA